MKKSIYYFLIFLALLLLSCCSKDSPYEEFDVIQGEGGNVTGISFVARNGLQATRVVFSLRRGGSETTYGQTLKGTYNVVKVQAEPYIMGKVKAISAGEEVPFRMYTVENGEKFYRKSTTVVEIKENEVYYVFIEPLN